VLADEKGLQELRNLGARSVPVVVQGDRWVDGQALQALADFVGVRWTHRMLPPRDLATRVDTVLSATERFAAQLPADKLGAMLPNGFRTYCSLATHVGQIIEAFLDLAEQGKRLENAAYIENVPAHVRTPADLAALLAGIRHRFDAWWSSAGATADYSVVADVYYGEQTLHEFFERSAWHAAQHARQVQLVLETLGIAPNGQLNAADLAGLPLPENVWDDKMAFSG
jgi:hypothetical protein